MFNYAENRIELSRTLFLVPRREYDEADASREYIPTLDTAKEFEWVDECWDKLGTPAIPGDLARAIAAAPHIANAFLRVTEWHRDIGAQYAIRNVLDI